MNRDSADATQRHQVVDPVTGDVPGREARISQAVPRADVLSGPGPAPRDYASLSGSTPLPGTDPGPGSSRPPAAVAPRMQQARTHVTRTRAYRFVLDENGLPIELGSGRFAKAFLGEEAWLESKTALRRKVAIKVLQRGVSVEDGLRFQMEKELLERVQGHPNIITLHASGESDDPDFIPEGIRDRVENDFMILDLCDMSLEERIKGVRSGGHREDLLRYGVRERLSRVLEYVVPIAAATEYGHLVRNVCHRDIKPANILLQLPNPRLRGATLEVRLADFNVGKVREEDHQVMMTRVQGVPGTIYFQAPEQENNIFELLVNVQQGSKEVEYFEDLFVDVTQNDMFQLFNRQPQYMLVGADRAKRRLLLDRAYQEPSETNVRGKVTKSVDRPADIYSLGALFYYLVTGGYGNPKTLYDAFHKFIEYEAPTDQNTVSAYIEHEYTVIHNLRAPRQDDEARVAPADPFFSYKHYLDGNGELIDREVMKIIAKAMIRNKTDSYCQAWDINTTGISDLVGDLLALYEACGGTRSHASYALARPSRWRGWWFRFTNRVNKRFARLRGGRHR